MAGTDQDPFDVPRAVLMTAGLAVANDRVVEALVKLLEERGILTAADLEARMAEPEFKAESAAQSSAFYRGIKG